MPRKKYNLFLFDLDGTLLDTAPEFHQSLNKLLKSHGLKNKNFTQVRSKVSDGVNALIEMAFNISETEDGFLNLRESMLETYKKVSLNSKLFPNVAKVLDAFQNSYGIRALADYDFAKSDTIISIDADFMSDWQGGNYSSSWSKNRVPNKENEKPKMHNNNVQDLSSFLVSKTIIECNNAVAISHGINAAFSTGSQNHHPPQPNS